MDIRTTQNRELDLPRAAPVQTETKAPAHEPQDDAIARQAAEADTAANGSMGQAQSTLTVPITLRGEVIGTVDLIDDSGTRHWSENEKALAATVVEQMAMAVENARLYDEAQRRAQETVILNEMAQALSGVLEPANLFSQVYEYLPRLMPAEAFLVWLYDPTTELVTRPALYDMGKSYPDDPEPRPPQGRLLQVIESHAPVIVNLTTEELDAERAKAAEIIGSSDPSASLAYVPLRVGSQLRGVLSAQTYTMNAYGAPQIALLTSVANHLATALENAQLFAQTEQVLAETQTLYEISARLNASNTLQEALEAASGPAIVQGAFAAALLRAVTDSDAETLARAGQIPDEFELAAVWPRSAELAGTTRRRMRRELVGQEEGLTNPGEPFLVGNIEQDPRLTPEAKAYYANSGIRAAALLPLRIGTRWIGALNYHWREPRTFAPRDVRLFRSIMAQAATVLDNRSLFEQTQVALQQTQLALEQVREAQGRLNLQYQTANILARASSLDDAADALLENTCRSLNWQVGEFWAVDEAAQQLVFRHIWHEDSPELDHFTEDTQERSIAPSEGLAARALAAKTPLWVTDISADPELGVLPNAKDAGLVSALAFPLASEANSFGTMVFFSASPVNMDDALMATLVGVGSQIGQFQERRRAEQSVRQQNTYLMALHDTTLGLIRRLDIDELLENIITRAGELVGTEHGYVHLIEPSGDELRMRVGIGIYQEFVGTRVKPGQGLAGTVWSDGEPIVVSDYREWERRLPMVDRDVLRAVVGVPLKSGDQTVGVLGMASLEEGRRFGAAQVEALNRFAELAAIALDNAQLYNASQQALRLSRRVAAREKASSEIADKLYAAPDVKAVLRTAAEELRRTTGSRKATVRLNIQAGAGNGSAARITTGEPG